MDCTTYPGTDCDTDHHLLVAATRIRLRRMHKKDKPPKLNLKESKEERPQEIAAKVTNRFTTLDEIGEKITSDV